MTRVSVIGCGNMGSALLRGLARTDTYHLTAIDLDPEARASVADAADETTDDTDSGTADADIVV
ncbi:NAD(P)-binding domain-containing protein, partial [Halorubrum pallidum]